MKKELITLLALLALTLTGCVEHKINKGVVVDKSKTHSHVVYNSVNGVLIPIRYPT